MVRNAARFGYSLLMQSQNGISKQFLNRGGQNHTPKLNYLIPHLKIFVNALEKPKSIHLLVEKMQNVPHLSNAESFTRNKKRQRQRYNDSAGVASTTILNSEAVKYKAEDCLILSSEEKQPFWMKVTLVAGVLSARHWREEGFPKDHYR